MNVRTELDIATDWIRGFATAYLPNDGRFGYSATKLRVCGISLLDLLSVFRTARVTSVGMNDDSDGQKGIWTVEGFDSDDEMIVAVIGVETEEMSVDLLEVSRVVSTKRASNGAE